MNKQDTISIMAAILGQNAAIGQDNIRLVAARAAIALYDTVEQELLNKKLGK